MKNAVLYFMRHKMPVDAVRIGLLAAGVTEFLMQKQVLTAVFTPILRLKHSILFGKIKKCVLYILKYNNTHKSSRIYRNKNKMISICLQHQLPKDAIPQKNINKKPNLLLWRAVINNLKQATSIAWEVA